MDTKNQNFFANPDKSGQVVRRIVALGVVCMLLFAMVSCDAAKEPIAQLSLEGTSWKLVGIVDTETGILRELEPTGYAGRLFTLTFNTSDFTAFAVANEYWGYYKANYETGSIVITNFGGTRILEPLDGKLFATALHFMQSFILTREELRIYSLVPEGIVHFEHFNDVFTNSYLLFKPF